MKISIIIICCSMLTSFSLAHATSVLEWSASLTPNSGVYQELSKFGGLSPQYVQSLPEQMRQKMFSEMTAATGADLQSQGCHDKMNVSFLKNVTAASSSDPQIAKFESEFIRIEMVKCLPGVQAHKAAQIYASPVYQRQAFDTVVSSQSNGNRICQATEAAVVGRSEYCFDNVILDTPEGSFVHSYNDFNANGVQAPVYFREILTASYAQPSGTLFYTLVYVRGVKLNSFFKGFAKSAIMSSQGKAMNLLSSMSK